MANQIDPDQTAHSAVSLIWVCTVCSGLSVPILRVNTVVGTRQLLISQIVLNKNEPVYDTTYKKTCAASEDSDQPALQCSLIRVFADCMCFLQPSSYLKKDK